MRTQRLRSPRRSVSANDLRGALQRREFTYPFPLLPLPISDLQFHFPTATSPAFSPSLFTRPLFPHLEPLKN